jgi:hypothetical protein
MLGLEQFSAFLTAFVTDLFRLGSEALLDKHSFDRGKEGLFAPFSKSE